MCHEFANFLNEPFTINKVLSTDPYVVESKLVFIQKVSIKIKEIQVFLVFLAFSHPGNQTAICYNRSSLKDVLYLFAPKGQNIEEN